MAAKKIKTDSDAGPKKKFDFLTTKDIEVSKNIIDQVIGQENAVNIVRKAAEQRRHVLLIGEPGTGKSMLGMALAELLPKEKLVDILSFPNTNDENTPLIRTMPAGQGREFVARSKLQSMSSIKNVNIIMIILMIVATFLPYHLYKTEFYAPGNLTANAIIYSATMVTFMMIAIGFTFMMGFGRKMENKALIPKVIVDNFGKKQVPFFDATGAHAGALLGDVLHDPFQSGGLGTPSHERVVAGMIHKAHMGVLFVDEIATLQPTTQQELLTSLQEGKYAITGQSERSAGAMVRTEAVPCKFILIAAGNYDTLQNMHPALRSRIRGYGYEVYMNDTMDDTPENRHKIAVFVAQEVRKDEKIPHFSKEAVDYMIEEARRKASRKGKLTVRLRELGGLVRAAGDIAMEEKAELVKKVHVEKAKKFAIALEGQIADKIIEYKKEYNVLKIDGKQVGRVNGLAVLGAGSNLSGIVMPIEAEVTLGGKDIEINATGGLKEIAKESVTNVSAIIKKYFEEDLKVNHSIYIQFLQEHGVEGDSASIAISVAIISALKQIPVKQDYAMTGSLSIRGEVLPIGGVSAKIEAAIETGIKNVIVPVSNMQDIVIDKEKLSKIKVIPVNNIYEVITQALDWTGKEAILNQIKKKTGDMKWQE